MIRAFFGIPILEEEQRVISEALHPIQDKLKNTLHWTLKKNWHVTTRFLGNVDRDAIAYLLQVAEELAQSIEKFPMKIKKISGFPSGNSRLIAAHIERSDPLDTIFTTLNDAAVNVGLPEEPRSFKPHITLGKFGRHVHRVDPIVFEGLLVHARELVLFESRPSGRGSEYIPLRRFWLRDYP